MMLDFRKERLAVCEECPRLFHPTWTCRECGCFMQVKATLPGAECPLGKWGKVNDAES